MTFMKLGLGLKLPTINIGKGLAVGGQGGGLNLGGLKDLGGLKGVLGGGKTCAPIKTPDHGHGHGHDNDDEDDDKPDLPEIAKDTSGITFHVDTDGDGKANEYYYIRSDEAGGTPGKQTFSDYLDTLKSDLKEDFPGKSPADLTIKATIYGPNAEESYYHFTGGEFDAAEEEDDDKDCGDGKGEGHHGHDHGKGHGKDLDKWWKSKPDDRDDDKHSHDKNCDHKTADKSDAGKTDGGKSVTKGAYWDKAESFLKGLAATSQPLPEDDHAEDQDDDEDANEHEDA